MTEMEMVRDLRRVVASVADKAGGNREKLKAEIRAELVSTVLDGHGKVRETSIADIMDVVGTNPWRRPRGTSSWLAAPIPGLRSCSGSAVEC